ncbi:MAG TPA: hypothetical protein VFX45_06900 [Solirubrobacterales bacterium]|nr:hypothetical protein [Solirubrobacterales bacterium]
MSIGVTSTPELAREVEAKAKAKADLPSGVAIAPVPEFATSPATPCDSTELLTWMGWMTAGPPTLAAEVLRSAGRWAWVRYRWALEDERGIVRPTADARSIRQHTRSLFSETVGVGAAGYLGCTRLVPTGSLAVVNLDDTIDPLLTAGVIRWRFGTKKKHPDYLIVRGAYRGPMELLAIECKGTVLNQKTAISQLAAGAKQVIGIESSLPMRSVVFATTMALDEKEPVVRSYAIEVTVEGRSGGEPSTAAREAIRNAALIRALRCAGLYAAAERTRAGYVADWPQPHESFQIGGRPMVGDEAQVVSGESRLRAEVGVDLNLLQALAAPRPERAVRLEQLAAEIPAQDEFRRRPIDTPERVEEEVRMRDGLGIRFERQGQLPREELAGEG